MTVSGAPKDRQVYVTVAAQPTRIAMVSSVVGNRAEELRTRDSMVPSAAHAPPRDLFWGDFQNPGKEPVVVVVRFSVALYASES